MFHAHLVDYILYPYLSTIDLITLSKLSKSCRYIKKYIFKKIYSITRLHPYLETHYIYHGFKLYHYLTMNSFSTYVWCKPTKANINNIYKPMYPLLFDFHTLYFDYTSIVDKKVITYDLKKLHENIIQNKYIDNVDINLINIHKPDFNSFQTLISILIDLHRELGPRTKTNNKDVQGVEYQQKVTKSVNTHKARVNTKKLRIRLKNAKYIIYLYMNMLCNIKNKFQQVIKLQVEDYYCMKNIDYKSHYHFFDIFNGYKSNHYLLNTLYQILSLYTFQIIHLERINFRNELNDYNKEIKCYNFIANDNFLNNIQDKQLYSLYKYFLKNYADYAEIHYNYKHINQIDKEKLRNLGLNLVLCEKYGDIYITYEVIHSIKV